jgi:hypothetical protein
MKTLVNPQIGRVGLEFGWYSGEEPSIFNLTLWNDCRDNIDMIIVFKFQIWKFIISVNLKSSKWD